MSINHHIKHKKHQFFLIIQYLLYNANLLHKKIFLNLLNIIIAFKCSFYKFSYQFIKFNGLNIKIIISFIINKHLTLLHYL